MRFIAALAFVLALPAAATADEPLRCGNWVVTLPISLADLLSKCGAPAAKEVTTQDIRTGGRAGGASRASGTTTTEKWTYHSGGQSMPMIVIIVDGTVTKIGPEN